MTVQRFPATFLSTCFLLIIFVIGVGSELARAQSGVPVPGASPNVASGPTISQQGSFVSAPIVLDGTTLFRIALPVTATSSGAAQLVLRIADVQTALAELVSQTGPEPQTPTIWDPRSLRVHVQRQGSVALLSAIDAKHPDPLPLLTVTRVDATYNQSDVDALATEWQAVLQGALVRELNLRQPAVERRSFFSVSVIGVGLVLATLTVWALTSFLMPRIERLTTEVLERKKAVDAQQVDAAPGDRGAYRRRRLLFAISLKALAPNQKLALYSTISESLIWAIILGWLIGTTWSLSRFAQTTPLASQIEQTALKIVATIIVAALVSRIMDVVISLIARDWRVRHTTNSEDRARLLLRIPTITQAVLAAKTSVLFFVAVLTVIGQLGVPITSVITFGGLAAIGLSLAAQNFVRDFLNGFLVLLEDQYVVGDFVTINTYSGIVEHLTLRMAQLRDVGGELITIPHSSVTSVVNQSRNWSRVDYRVSVDPNADIARAMQLVRHAIETLAQEDAWSTSILNPIEWIGIDSLSRDWVIVRASVKTAPLQQFEFRRDINERVQTAFASAGIAFGAQPP